MKNVRIVSYLKDRQFNHLDLLMIIIFTILSVIFILIPPYNQTFLRIIFALSLLLFLPGYMLIAAMFPRRGELSAIERFTMSIGLSIAITVFDGFGLNYTRWGFRPNSITISLSIMIGILFLITIIQRWRYRKESYSFSLGDIRSFYKILRTKEKQREPEYDPALEKMLIQTMIIAIIIVSAMLIYAKVTFENEKFTTLYILGANGKAENYLTDLSVGKPSKIMVGIENYEYATINYTLRVNLGGKTLREDPIILEHGSKWLSNITFIPELTSSIAFAGANKSKLEFELLKENKTYRSVHLLVNTSLDKAKFSELPNLINGDMELNEGWLFLGSSPDIKGRYLNETNASWVYEIDYSSENFNPSGIIYQNLTTHGDALATLSFDVRDSEYSNTSSFDFKQALLDGEVIWEERIGDKNNSWEHIDVPVLLSGNNTLAFRVYSVNKTSLTRSVWWDNIKLNPYRPQLGVAIEKGGFAVKLSGLSNTDNLSSIKFSIENVEKTEKIFDLTPSPVLIDDIGNQYEALKIELVDKAKQSSLNPGALKKGTIIFKPINNSAKYLLLTIYLNGEKYEFSLQSESKILEEDDKVSIRTIATMGDIITQDGFEVMLRGFQNQSMISQRMTSQVIISFKNMENEEKPFDLNPSPVLIDDLGHQYGMVRNDGISSQIKQTIIYPDVVRRGIIFFEPINPEAKNLRLIIYLNGEKYVFGFKAESKIIAEDLVSNISFKTNATLGETFIQDGFAVMVRGFQNQSMTSPSMTSQVIISVKNMENQGKMFSLIDPSPVLIDDLGNQYQMVWMQKEQIKMTLIYPYVVRRGIIFFEPINPDAKYFRLILYLNKMKYEIDFKAESKIIEEKGLPGNLSTKIPINAIMGETITRGGFEIKLTSFENTRWWSSVFISVKNIENEDKAFKFISPPILIDDLSNQYEVINIQGNDPLKQTTIAPLGWIEGKIFFEPVRTEAKYIIFILRISSENYVFGFEPKYNST